MFKIWETNPNRSWQANAGINTRRYGVGFDVSFDIRYAAVAFGPLFASIEWSDR